VKSESCLQMQVKCLHKIFQFKLMNQSLQILSRTIGNMEIVEHPKVFLLTLM